VSAGGLGWAAWHGMRGDGSPQRMARSCEPETLVGVEVLERCSSPPTALGPGDHEFANLGAVACRKPTPGWANGSSRAPRAEPREGILVASCPPWPRSVNLPRNGM